MLKSRLATLAFNPEAHQLAYLGRADIIISTLRLSSFPLKPPQPLLYPALAPVHGNNAHYRRDGKYHNMVLSQ
jgi:hypothetical protein